MQMIAIPMAILIPPFYARDLGLSLAATGAILMIARITDVFTDPVIGILSDQSRSKYGRRRPFIVLGLPITLVATYMIFAPKTEVTNSYFAFWTIALWLGWTFINIPYLAWGAELSTNYHERTRIATWRTASGICGTLFAIGVPLIAWQMIGYGDQLDESLTIIAYSIIIMISIAATALVLSVPEGIPRERKTTPFLEGLRIMWRNQPYKRLLLGFILNGIAVSLPGPLYILYVIHVIGSDIPANLILLLFYSGMLAGVAFWGWLSNRIGKRQSWLTGMCLLVLIHPWYLTLGLGDIELMRLLLVTGGFCGGIWVALPASMKADVIDIDRLESGRDRTGLFFSTWSFATKLIPALSVGIAFQVLDLTGFQASGTNAPSEILTLKILFAGVPTIFWLLAIVTVWHYPITEEYHRKLLRELREQ